PTEMTEMKWLLRLARGYRRPTKMLKGCYMVRRTPCASHRSLPQAVNQRGQLVGQRRTVAAPDRPGQLKAAGMQKHAFEAGRRRLPVVKPVAGQGVANGRGVNADLVRAPGFQPRFRQAVAVQFFNPPEM